MTFIDLYGKSSPSLTLLAPGLFELQLEPAPVELQFEKAGRRPPSAPLPTLIAPLTTQTTVARVARLLAGSFLIKYSQQQEPANRRGKKRALRIENVKEIMAFIKTLNGKKGLHRKLLATGAVIIWKDNSAPLTTPTDDDPVPDLEEVDTVQSYAATLFQLMRHFPGRFCSYDPSPDDPDQFIWDYHHEDWFRAHVCLFRLLQRRRENPTISSKDTTRPVKDWPGYIGSAVDLDAAEEEDDGRSALLDAMTFESEVLGGDWGDSTGEGGYGMATREELRATLGDEAADMCTYGPDGTLEDDRLGRLSELITRGVNLRLELDNPSTDPMQAAEEQRRKDGKPAPSYPTRKELAQFADVLYQRAHVEYNGKPDVTEVAESMGQGDARFRGEDPAVQLQRKILQSAEAVGDEGDEDDDNGNERGQGIDDGPMAIPNTMSDFVPDCQLLDVCRALGIAEWRKIQLNPEGAPSRFIRPNQICGKY